MQLLGKTAIRRAIPINAEGIAFVHIKGWQESYKGMIDQNYLDNLSQDIKARTQRWQSLIAKSDQDSIQLVAIFDDKIIGFCSAGPIRKSTETKGELYAIYLLDEFKGLGVGKMLWDKAVEHLSAKKLIPFDVVLLETNIPARTFYERQGCIFIKNEVGDIEGKEYKEVRYRFI